LKRRQYTLLGGAAGSMHLPRIARLQQAGQQKAAIVELIASVFMIDSYWRAAQRATA
jgi:hypothetical protein